MQFILWSINKYIPKNASRKRWIWTNELRDSFSKENSSSLVFAIDKRSCFYIYFSKEFLFTNMGMAWLLRNLGFSEKNISRFSIPIFDMCSRKKKKNIIIKKCTVQSNSPILSITDASIFAYIAPAFHHSWWSTSNKLAGNLPLCEVEISFFHYLLLDVGGEAGLWERNLLDWMNNITAAF